MRRGRNRSVGPASDDELIERARSGEQYAFGELYRRHRQAAVATARFLLRSPTEADDVVADAFAGVLAAIRHGYGPRDNFRRYLLASVRNGCRMRGRRVMSPDQQPRQHVRATSTFEDPERYVEADTVARAFASLNPRWQQTLWLTEVEQRSTAEVGERLHLAPNAAAALTHRAREAFATAYLAEHVRASPDEACATYAPRLAAYVRDQLTNAQRNDVEAHLVACPHCRRAVSELRELNTSLRTLAPLAGAGAAAPASLGTSIGGSSVGLLGGGLLKGAAALFVLAPVLVTDSPGGGEAERRTITVEAADAAADDAVSPAVRVASTSVAGRSPTTTTTTTTTTASATASTIAGRPIGRTVGAAAALSPVSTVAVISATVTTVPAPDGDLLEPITALVDDVLTDVVTPLVDGLLTETVVPLVEGAVSEVVAPVLGLVDRVIDAPIPVVDAVAGSLVLPATGEAVDLVGELLGGPDASDTDQTGTPPPPISPQPTPPQPTAPPSAVAPSPSAPSAPASPPGQPAATTVPVPPPANAAPATLLPPITVPAISVPPVTLPLNLPHVTLPLISVAPITIPDLLGG